MSNEPGLEKQAIENLLFETLREQRRKRRWGIFFKLLILIYLVAFLSFLFFGPSSSQIQGDKSKPHIAVIDINGVIDEKTLSNADGVIKSLNQAFKARQVKAVVLRINSPGGSPVQASTIYDEILRSRAKNKNIKVYAVCGDICASAAYYIASATDQIYANPLSLVGSIGVIMEGFGFDGTMHKVGIDRRLFVSGDRKGFLDPFSPVKKEDVVYVQKMLNIVHQQFIRDVQKARGSRLKQDPLLFSGLIWTGLQALPMGLIDGFGSLGSVSREVIKNDNVVDYTYYPGYLDTLANRFMTMFHHELSSREQVGIQSYLGSNVAYNLSEACQSP
jgi:protease IV